LYQILRQNWWQRSPEMLRHHQMSEEIGISGECEWSCIFGTKSISIMCWFWAENRDKDIRIIEQWWFKHRNNSALPLISIELDHEFGRNTEILFVKHSHHHFNNSEETGFKKYHSTPPNLCQQQPLGRLNSE
jgi:hypothetical protein